MAGRFSIFDLEKIWNHIFKEMDSLFKISKISKIVLTLLISQVGCVKYYGSGKIPVYL